MTMATMLKPKTNRHAHSFSVNLRLIDGSRNIDVCRIPPILLARDTGATGSGRFVRKCTPGLNAPVSTVGAAGAAAGASLDVDVAGGDAAAGVSCGAGDASAAAAGGIAGAGTAVAACIAAGVDADDVTGDGCAGVAVADGNSCAAIVVGLLSSAFGVAVSLLGAGLALCDC